MEDSIFVKTLEVGSLGTNCYIVACKSTSTAMVVDPGDDAALILNQIESEQLSVQYILNTHAHFDHIGANKPLKDSTKADLLLHSMDLELIKAQEDHASYYGLQTIKSPEPDRFVEDQEPISLGNLLLKVLHTPGHSPGGISLLAEEFVIVGDTLFKDSIGRTDLPGGNHRELVDSINAKLMVLKDDILVLPGHGPSTTIGRERRYNSFLL